LTYATFDFVDSRVNDTPGRNVSKSYCDFHILSYSVSCPVSTGHKCPVLPRVSAAFRERDSLSIFAKCSAANAARRVSCESTLSPGGSVSKEREKRKPENIRAANVWSAPSSSSSSSSSSSPPPLGTRWYPRRVQSIANLGTRSSRPIHSLR